MQPSGAGDGGVAFSPSRGGELVAAVRGEHAQNLPHGDQPRAGGPHATDLHTVGGAQGAGMRETQSFPFQGLVALQVLQAEQAWVVGVLLHLIDQSLGDVALVKSLGAFCRNAFEDGGQRRVAQAVPDGPRLTIRLKEIGCGLVVTLKCGVGT